MGRTTLALGLIADIEQGLLSKEQILERLEEGCADDDTVRRGAVPSIRVTAHLLEVRPPPEDRPTSMLRRLASGFLFKKVIVDLDAKLPPAPTYREEGSAELFDLTGCGRIDVIRVGRHPSQDLQILERHVSREHALVVFSGRNVLYCDYGTQIESIGTSFSVRPGSTCGTYRDNGEPIRGKVICWRPDEQLMVGGIYPTDPTAFGCYLSYRRLAPAAGPPSLSGGATRRQ